MSEVQKCQIAIRDLELDLEKGLKCGGHEISIAHISRAILNAESIMFGVLRLATKWLNLSRNA